MFGPTHIAWHFRRGQSGYVCVAGTSGPEHGPDFILVLDEAFIKRYYRVLAGREVSKMKPPHPVGARGKNIMSQCGN